MRTQTLNTKPLLHRHPQTIRLRNGDQEVKVNVPDLPHRFSPQEARHIRRQLGGTVHEALTIAFKALQLTPRSDGEFFTWIVSE